MPPVVVVQAGAVAFELEATFSRFERLAGGPRTRVHRWPYLVDNGVARTGAVICWENYMPLLRTAMYQKGVELYCAPTVDDRELWISTMRHVALEGRCFVLSSCQFATRADLPQDYASSFGDDPQTVLICGGSCIVSPLGELLVEPQYGRSGVFTADVELGAIAEAKLGLDVVGHYGRPDVFSLQVDESEQRNVNFARDRGPVAT